MPIIDAHIHLWSHDMDRYPDIAWRETGTSRLPPADGSAERVVGMMDEAGVAWALNVQVPWYCEDNRYHHDAVARFPGRFSFLCVLDLNTPGAGERLRAMHAEEGAQGVRVHLGEPGRTDKLTDGTHDDVLSAARELGVPVQFLGRAEHMDAVLDVVRRFEGIKVVIDHLCHPDPAYGPDYAPWRGYFTLSEYPEAYVKVSLQVNCSKAPYPFGDLHGFEKRTLDRFGPEHCMWGSNFPLFPDSYSYTQILDIVREHLPFLSERDRDQILGGTASGLWAPLS